MRYRLEIKEEARQQLRTLSKEQRRNIGRRLDALQTNLSGRCEETHREEA